MTPERIHKIKNVLTRRQNDITVILENVFDPHNISAVMRTCDSVGIQEIYIVNTRQPRQKNWGYRSSGSAVKWLTIHVFDKVDDCIKAVRKKHDLILTTHLSSDAVNVYQLDLTQKVALAFGNEQLGLSTELIALSDGNFIIPQVGMIESLNISVACAVTLYEAYRQKSNAGHYSKQKLPETEFAALKKQWAPYENL